MVTPSSLPKLCILLPKILLLWTTTTAASSSSSFIIKNVVTTRSRINISQCNNNRCGVTSTTRKPCRHDHPTTTTFSPLYSSPTTTIPPPPLTTTSTKLHPLLSSLLQTTTTSSSSSSSSSSKPLSTITPTQMEQISQGLTIWQSALTKGRLPISSDFTPSSSSSSSSSTTTTTTTTTWPSEPLYTKLCDFMVQTNLPRFVLRHSNVVVGAVLLSLLNVVWSFEEEEQCAAFMSAEEEEDYDDDYYNDYDEAKEQYIEKNNSSKAPSDQEISNLADEIISSQLTQRWVPILSGVSSLDSVFGYNHGLLLNDDDNEDNNDEEGKGKSSNGFGLNNGIWSHTGWSMIPKLQSHLSSIQELKELTNRLGKRPSAEIENNSSKKKEKFLPRVQDQAGGDGAMRDGRTRGDSMDGLRLTGNLEEILPSEAVLLKGRRVGDSDGDSGGSKEGGAASSSALRRLFLAKKMENKLWGYDPSSYTDLPSIPKTSSNFLTRMPSSTGGPIIICLDTSYSMTGNREILSKAVVLSCVSAAFRQKRLCRVVSFSNSRGVMEVEELSADVRGVKKLLEFLECGFGGGTDVTGALRYIIETTMRKGGNNNSTGGGVGVMDAADLLLVTDGEIPDPPVSDVLMEEIDGLKRRTGMEIHGLLIGKTESKPLSKLCTEVHDFLGNYDGLEGIIRDSIMKKEKKGVVESVGGDIVNGGRSSYVGLRAVSPVRPTRAFGSSLSPLRPTTRTFSGDKWRNRNPIWYSGCLRRNSLTLLSARYYDDDGWEETGRKGGRKQKKSGRKSGKKKKWSDDDDMSDDYNYDGNYLQQQQTLLDPYGDENENDYASEEHPTQSAFNSRVEEAITKLRDAADAAIQDSAWNAATLEHERNSDESCWKYRTELKAAVNRVEEGLVERGEESRLIVLGTLAREHVLLLGPPGTGKSALGRRLSQLCGGPFFQRLLTRFTTPEEIFGPLSLRALENDEYRRCTEGFLPTASVAFLDEIFKANSAILNTLLTVLNERRFDNGAGVREVCPIRCVVGASNELPDSDELDALYDRFLLRKEVRPVSDEGLVMMLSMPSPGSSPCDDVSIENGESSSVTKSNADECGVVFSEGLDRVVDALSSASENVQMGSDACALLRDLRTYMREEMNVEVSDRRLVRAARLLKISAASHGRSKVDPVDCFLLQHISWRLPEQRAAVREWLWDNLTPGSSDGSDASVSSFRLLLGGLRRELLERVRGTSGCLTTDSGARPSDVKAIESLRNEVSHLKLVLQGRAVDLARHVELLQQSEEHLWLDPDEARAARQLLLPRALAASQDVGRALSDAHALELALLADHPSSPPDDLRLSVIEMLWDDDIEQQITFTEEELSIDMRDAKKKYDADTFRKWKRARKKINK